MDALDVVKVCLRRWWVFVPVVALALGAGLGIVRSEKSSYGAYASFALVYEQPSNREAEEPDPRVENPLSEEGGVLLGEAIVAELVTAARQRELGDPAARGAEPGLDARGARFTVTLPNASSSYYINAWSEDEQAAEETVDAVLAALPAVTASIQDRAGAPERSQYLPFTTTFTQVAELPPGSLVKTMVGVLGIGVLAGAALAILIDALLQRRKRAQLRDDEPSGFEPPALAPRSAARSAARSVPRSAVPKTSTQRLVPMQGSSPPRPKKKSSRPNQGRTASG